MTLDVFPRRNLPNEAEQWGRDVEIRLSHAKTRSEALGQFSRGQNRNTASSLEALSRSLQRIPEIVPLVSAFSGWGVTTSWATIGTLDVPPPPAGRTTHALIRWDVQAVSTPGPDGAYMMTRATYTGGLSGSGDRWVGWGRDWINLTDRHATSSAHVVESDAAFTVSIQSIATDNGIIVADSQNAVRINALVVYS